MDHRAKSEKAVSKEVEEASLKIAELLQGFAPHEQAQIITATAHIVHNLYQEGILSTKEALGLSRQRYSEFLEASQMPTYDFDQFFDGPTAKG